MRFTEKEVKDHIVNIGRAIEDYIEEFENRDVLENPRNHSTSPGPLDHPLLKKGDRDVIE